MNCFKHLPLPHLYNFRDMGGYFGKDHRIFSYQKLFRSDVPDQLSSEEWTILKAVGIRTIIDLRSESEQRFMNYPVPDGFRKISLPLQAEKETVCPENSARHMARQALKKNFTQLYEEILFHNLPQTAEILRTVSESLPLGGILFHCSLGKDRTGILAALLYTLCEVSPADIIADYQISETYLAGNQRIRQLIPGEIHRLIASDPAQMELFLQRLQIRNIRECLTASGFGPEAQRQLTESLLLPFS